MLRHYATRHSCVKWINGRKGPSTNRGEVRERFERFLESKRVTSLHLGHHRTATLHEVQSHTFTEYLAHALLDSREQRAHRQAVKLAACEHHGRLVSEFEKAQQPTITQPESWQRRPANANHLSPIRKRSIWRSTPSRKTMNQKDNYSWNSRAARAKVGKGTSQWLGAAAAKQR